MIIVHWTHREWSMSLSGLAKAGVSPHESVISVSHTVNTHSEQHKEDYLESIALLSHFKSQSPGRIIQILQGKKKHTFFNISTALGQMSHKHHCAYMTYLFVPFWKLFSSFKAHLQSLAGWRTNNSKGWMHGSRGKPCQAETHTHGYELHKSFTKYLFYVTWLPRANAELEADTTKHYWARNWGKKNPFLPTQNCLDKPFENCVNPCHPKKRDIQKTSSQSHKEPLNMCPKLEEVTENSAVVLTHSLSDKVAFTTPSPPPASATNSLHRAC